MNDNLKKYIFKILIDLIPALLFIISTFIFFNSTLIYNIFGVFISFILLVIAFASLDLHTYLINKYNLN